MKCCVKLILSVAVMAAVCWGEAPVWGDVSEPLVFEVAADTPVVRTGGRQRVVVRALVRPESKPASRRAPLAVALVLDKSGSMGSGGKMENAKRGAIEALEVLDRRDVAAVVVYDNSASVLVPGKSLAAKGEFVKAVSRIRAGGSTALYDGVQAGARQLRPFIEEGYIPRIVLLSDGMANVGPSSTGELAKLGRTLAAGDITITTIGLGLDYNEDLMTALSSESGGNAYFAKDADRLPEIFARDMGDAVTLSARKVRITLSCGDSVRPVGIVGRTGSVSEGSLEASIDNLYGAEKYALFELELPEADEEKPLDAAVVKLEYVDAVSGETVTRETSLKIDFVDDEKVVEKNRRADIVSQTAVAKNSEVREQAVRLADEGRIAEASQLLKERTDDLKKIAPSAGAAAPKLEAEAQYFDSLADELSENKHMSNVQRKANVNQAYAEKNQQAAVGEPISEDVK